MKWFIITSLIQIQKISLKGIYFPFLYSSVIDILKISINIKIHSISSTVQEYKKYICLDFLYGLYFYCNIILKILI